MTFEGLQIQGAVKIMEKLTVSKKRKVWYAIECVIGVNIRCNILMHNME